MSEVDPHEWVQQNKTSEAPSFDPCVMILAHDIRNLRNEVHQLRQKCTHLEEINQELTISHNTIVESLEALIISHNMMTERLGVMSKLLEEKSITPENVEVSKSLDPIVRQFVDTHYKSILKNMWKVYGVKSENQVSRATLRKDFKDWYKMDPHLGWECLYERICSLYDVELKDSHGWKFVGLFPLDVLPL